MNKKKLSVVMAGAMLASSVAPVLAAEVTKEEVQQSRTRVINKRCKRIIKFKSICF